MFPAIFAFLLVTLSCLSEALEQGLGTLHRRTYFYVGQAYTAQGNSTIAADQMYVEHLTPAKVTQPLPILFIHGQGMTGHKLVEHARRTTWLSRLFPQRRIRSTFSRSAVD